MASSSPSPMFTVRRCQPELVAPAIPTPHELKLLSDIDDQDGLRFHIPTIHIYRNEPSMAEKDPVKVIRQALAQTLVFYYPLAGRLREGPGRKLMVDCTGEGVLFVEADADATLDQFGDALQPPFPCFDELLCDVLGSEEITNTPLLLVQLVIGSNTDVRIRTLANSNLDSSLVFSSTDISVPTRVISSAMHSSLQQFMGIQLHLIRVNLCLGTCFGLDGWIDTKMLASHSLALLNIHCRSPSSSSLSNEI